MSVAVFDYNAWADMFPELATVTEPVAQSFFNIAGLLLDNTDCSPVVDVTIRLSYLNFATAHLVSLAGYPIPAGGSTPVPSGVIGRISSATEGTVTVQSQWAASVSASEAFWMQTQYGLIFWQLTRALRTMRYIAAPPRQFERFGGAYLGGRRLY